MPSQTHTEIETSRAKLLDAIAGATDITFVRSYGNIGDHLIYAGTRRLLSGVQYKETSIRNLSGAGGDLALISGGGAWCGPYHDTPKYLPEVEEKFRRVIVMPSSFDISAPGVGEALAKTRALVFARERVSYEQIKGLCKADLAHDCAFFFDYGPYQRPGSGTLYAYRTDAEAVPQNLPTGNDDISLTCETLDEWLWTISRSEIVRTDRAHVMIAASMLGKRVFFRASSYHKLPAIADFALRSFPVALEEAPDTAKIRERLKREAGENLALLPRNFFTRRSEVEITIVMLSYYRLDQTLNAIRALKENVAVPFKLLLVDNNSGPDIQNELRRFCANYDFIELVLLDENLGCVGGRDYAMKRVRTPYVMLIDNDIEVFPGAVEHLLNRLEANPRAQAATGRVIFPDGMMHLCGGGFRIEDSVLCCELFGFGSRFDDWAGESGPCQWVPGCLTLFRSKVLIDHPYDLGMRNYYEDLEWCYRLNQSGAGDFHRVVESVALHFHERKDLNDALPVEERRKSVMKYIETMAYFYKIHGIVIPDIFKYVPELGPPSSPLGRVAARLFLAMINAYGTEWALEKWNSGELAPIFSAGAIEEERLKAPEMYKARVAELEQKLLDIYQSRHWKLFDRYWRIRQSVRSLFTSAKALLLPPMFAFGAYSFDRAIATLLSFIGVNG
jgi:GT2 family glycosyltransferase